MMARYKLRTGNLTKGFADMFDFLEIPYEQKYQSIVLRNLKKSQIESLSMIASTLDLSDFISVKQLKQVSEDDLLQLKYQIACIAAEALEKLPKKIKHESPIQVSRVAALEQEVKELMASVPMYHVAHRGGMDWDEWDAREITQDDLDIVAPGGIHCADDIRGSGWLFDSPRNGHLGTRLSEDIEYDTEDDYERY